MKKVTFAPVHGVPVVSPIPADEIPPAVWVGLGMLAGVVGVIALLAAAMPEQAPQRRRVILLPAYPVWKHCMCGYPARDQADLVKHFDEMHYTAAPEVRAETLNGRENDHA